MIEVIDEIVIVVFGLLAIVLAFILIVVLDEPLLVVCLIRCVQKVRIQFLIYVS